jgi:hypothetical protein
MACCKNVGGGPSDEHRHLLHLTVQQKVKGKVTTKKKHKRDDIEAKRAIEIAVAAERVERGGRGSGIQIGEAQFHLEGRELGTKGTEEIEEEEPTPQTEEQAEQTRLWHSTCTHTQVSPRLVTQRRGSHPPPRPQGSSPVVHLDLTTTTTR